MDVAEADVIKGHTEAEVMKELFPILRAAVTAVSAECEDLDVFDSQTSCWLPQTKSGSLGNSLKPDGFCLLKHFGTRNGRPALNSLFKCVRALVEGKKNSTLSNEALGQAAIYAEKLEYFGIPFVHVCSKRCSILRSVVFIHLSADRCCHSVNLTGASH